MTTMPLAGVRVVENASFVAGPSGCMTLAQLGADVIRVDPVGGASDYRRWPVSRRTGDSLYWTALNKGKRSVALNLRSPEGRDLLAALATAPGPAAGILVENSVGRPWLAYDQLVRRRADLVQIHIQGHADGRPAVDYTVNPEVGIPDVTGPLGLSGPVNHVLPAWDMLTGMTAVTGLLAALYQRERTGFGSHLQIALADVALAGVGNLGWYAEADELGANRPRVGNHLYGSFGVDFATSDGHRVMVVALTPRQWDALRSVTKTEEVFSALESALGVDLSEETDRYTLRETIAAILRPWFEARTLSDVTRDLEAAQVLWSRYRTMADTVRALNDNDPECVLTRVDQPGIGSVVSSRSPIRTDDGYGSALPAPELGQHTDEVLEQILGLSPIECGRLQDAGVVAGAA